MLGYAALLLAFSGSAWLALAMVRHHRDATGQKPAPETARRMRIAGTVLWIIALALCVVFWGVPVGLVMGIFCLSFMALPVALLLSYAPHRLRPLAHAGLAVAGLLCGVALLLGPLRDPFPFG